MSDKTPDIKLGDLLELDIIEINNLGVGVARKDGFVIFVKGGVSGDKVSAKVIKVAKSFAVARLEKIISPSPYREDLESACKEPAACGGCVWRNVSFEHELLMKQKYVSSAFLKVGIDEDKARVLPVIHTDKIYRYRNKAQYPVASFASGIKAGFYATKTHNIIPISDCPIQNPEFAPIVRLVCDFANENKISAYDEKSGKGLLRHIYLRSADKTGELMLCLVINGSTLPSSDPLIKKINESFPSVVSIYLNINRKNTNVVLGEEYRLLFGKEFIEDVLCGVRFRIAPEAFYQVNRDGAELLYNKAAELAVEGDKANKPTVIDLYCGAGTIGLSLAKAAKRVVGIDIVEKSIECAKENARLNGIDNAEFFCADAGEPENIKKCLDKAGVELSESVVILDPPRKGSTPELIEFLAEQNVGKVVYISCNPETLARDAECFLKCGYTLGDVQPVNMFPRTAHVETVVLLSRQINFHEMKLNSAPFEMIKNGTKSIELRLFDEKRQKIKKGDVIAFTNTSSGEKIMATVKKLHRFDSFEELYKSLPLLQCGYTTEDINTAQPSDMEQYYSIEEQSKYGVVGIELFPVR